MDPEDAWLFELQDKLNTAYHGIASAAVDACVAWHGLLHERIDQAEMQQRMWALAHSIKQLETVFKERDEMELAHLEELWRLDSEEPA